MRIFPKALLSLAVFVLIMSMLSGCLVIDAATFISETMAILREAEPAPGETTPAFGETAPPFGESSPPNANDTGVQPTYEIEPDYSVVGAGEERYLYHYLNEQEKKLYKDLVSAIIAHKPTISLDNSVYDSLYFVLDVVLADYPEFFWVEMGGGTTYTNFRGYRADIEYTLDYYIEDREERLEMQAQVDAATKRFLARIEPDMTEYEKVKLVYDYIIMNTEYDEGLIDDQSLYGVLVNGEGVCSGYARASQYLLNRLGIFSLYIPGEIRGGEGHAWNLVEVDGELYYFDATWDDPGYTGEEEYVFSDVEYDYFCVTSDFLSPTHIIESDWTERFSGFLSCTATENNYYVKNGLYLDDYDYYSLLEVFKREAAADREEIAFRFSNDEAYFSALIGLFQNDEVFSLLEDADIIPPTEDGGINYYTYDDIYVIKIDI